MAKSDMFEKKKHTHTHKCNDDPGGTLASLRIVSKLLALNSAPFISEGLNMILNFVFYASSHKFLCLIDRLHGLSMFCV